MLAEEKKIGKNKVKIVLEKNGCTPISVICPNKIKANALLTWLTLRFSGFPQFNVTPTDWKNFWLYILAFISIFIFGWLGTSVSVIFIVIALADLIFNIIITANYYFNFIRKKLKEGYEIRDSEQRAICEKAGVYKNLNL